MKKNYALLSLLMLMLFSACDKKRPVPNIPGGGEVPGDTSKQRTFRLAFVKPASQNDALDNLTAIVNVINHNNDVVLSNKIIAVSFDQQYKSAPITLPKGNYKLTGFIVKQSAATVKFASPVAGSAKAVQVLNPLSIPIVLDEKIEKQIQVDVLPVQANEGPQLYGYPEGSFGTIPDDEQTVNDKRIFIRPLIKIGNIVYDSVPVQLILRSWDAQNTMSYRAYSFPAGMQSIYLPKEAVKYQLSITKWGTSDQLVLMKDEVVEDQVYVIGGSKEGKKLKSVITSKIFPNGSSRPENKFNYEYHANGELDQMVVWAKRADQSSYIFMTNKYEYNNSRITKIKGYDEDNSLAMSSSYTYDNNGRVIGIEEIKGSKITRGTVQYFGLDGGTGISGDHRVEIEQSFEHDYYKTYYSKNVHGGVVISDVAGTTHGNREEGLYEHDFGVNPYAILGIPDVFLSNYSKHNIKNQWKTWFGFYPTVEAISFTYTYDGDGYPTQLLTKYRNYITKEYEYTIKTAYTY